MTISHSSAVRALRAAVPAGFFAALAMASPAGAETTNVANRCARLGSDYVAVSGTDGCVRLGGHVRVKVSQSATPMNYAPQDGFRNAAVQAPSHSGGAPFGIFETFPR